MATHASAVIVTTVMANREVSITTGLVGRIWRPACICAKDTTVKIGDKPWHYDAKTLREALLHITNDGDFQSCVAVNGVLTITHTTTRGSSTVKRTRQWPLDMFPSIADMVGNDEDLNDYYDAKGDDDF